MDLNAIISRLRAHPGDPSITITTSAAHTYMEAELVRGHLGKLEKAAGKLLLEHYDESVAAPVIERLRALLGDAGRVGSLPGMALFVNKDIAEVVHLPFKVNEGVTVGSTFHMRELLRTGLDSIAYHVLVLGRDEARLYEANDAEVIREVHGGFPVKNMHHTTDVVQVTTARGQVHQERRFHQVVDQAVRAHVGPDGIVVPACTVARHGAFLGHVEDPRIYHGHLRGSFGKVAPRDLVAKAWKVVHAGQQQRMLKELERAAEGPPALFLGAVDEIWSAVMEGRGDVLFVERDRNIAARIQEERLVLMSEDADHQPGFDLVDQLIEEQLAHGGQVRLLPNGSMEHLPGIALKLRY